jgi:hypothetical protein
MKKTVIALSIAMAFGITAAKADDATLAAFSAAGIQLSDEQVAQIASQSCSDDSSCNQLADVVAQIAASFEGNDEAVNAVVTAFASTYPQMADSLVTKVIAIAPATAISLAELAVEAAPTAAGVAPVAQRASNVTAPTPAAGGGSASPN